MEKIYVDKPQKKNKFNAFNISLGLTFAVAFIAMVSILLVGLSGQSYALDDESTPETIQTKLAGQDVYSFSGFHPVRLYAGTAGNEQFPVFCLESNVEFTAGKTLNRGDLLDDTGYAYLFSKLENLPVNEGGSEAISSYVKSWIEQTAIWAYIGQVTDPDDDKTDKCFIPDHMNDDDVEEDCYYEVKTTTKLEIHETSNPNNILGTVEADTPFYEKYGVTNIINQAIYYHENDIDALSLTINKAGNEFSLTEDGKYFRSPKLTVVASEGVEGFAEVKDEYALSLVGAPEGSYVEGINISSGKATRLTDLDNLSLSEYKELYVYVPKDKVTETTKKFDVTLAGNFEIYSGYRYTSVEEGVQSVTRLKTLVTSTEKGTPLEIVYSPKVPDTAMNASQGIYLVGLIVLLTGLGILYVNVKKQQKQN